jgi:predicted GTPase
MFNLVAVRFIGGGNRSRKAIYLYYVHVKQLRMNNIFSYNVNKNLPTFYRRFIITNIKMHFKSQILTVWDYINKR